MKKLIAAFLLAIPAASAADLLVAAASDLAPLGPSIQAAYERASGKRIVLTFASSGSLTRQIENGAPFDVFLSASDQYVTGLVQQGYADAATVRTYACGRLALWSANNLARDLKDLMKSEVLHIAIANPEHAPYGIAARQLLERQGLWKAVVTKIVYAENVRQALQFAESRNADAVITSWTLLKGKGTLLAADAYDPIRQTGAVLKSAGQPEAGRMFLDFLMSASGQKILEEGGLAPLPVAAPPKPAAHSPAPAPRPASAVRRSGRRSR